MAFSVSPSVIVREVDASAAVPAIATAPAAIAGDFNWGPTNEAILITSESNLVARFGKPDDSNFETFFAAADYLSYANALYVSRASRGGTEAISSADIPDPANNELTISVDAGFSAKYEGALGNNIQVAYVKGGSFSASVLDAGDIPNSYEATPGDSNTLTSQSIDYLTSDFDFRVVPANRITETIEVGDVLRIGNDSAGYQDFVVSSFAEGEVLNQANNQITDYYTYQIDVTGKYTLGELAYGSVKIEKKFKYHALFNNEPSSAEHMHVVVVDEDGGISGTAGYILETYSDLSEDSSASLSDGRTNYYQDVINNGSAWIKTANTIHLEATEYSYETLAGGSDGGTATLGQTALAWDVFKNTNEIDISFAIVGKSDDAATIPNYVISNIADYRKDVVAFVSPSKEAVVDTLVTETKMTNIVAFRNKLQNSSYWFLDSGYKYRYDKYNDTYRWVPLNGDTAGLAARVEPYESPAGFRKGVIKNVVKLAFNPNKPQRDVLYSSDINPVMSQVGQGIILFGDKTGLGLPSAFDRLNVRRLFIAVEKAIANAAQSFLFELNDEFTQTQFKNIVDPFLREIQGRRGITDFRVVSDGTVNTAEVIDANQFRANIFIKPARSINVIELTFVATRTGIEFDEIVGSLS